MNHSRIVLYSLFLIALISIFVLAYRLNSILPLTKTMETFSRRHRKKGRKRYHRHHRHHHHSSSSSSSSDGEHMPYNHDVLYGYKVSFPDMPNDDSNTYTPTSGPATTSAPTNTSVTTSAPGPTSAPTTTLAPAPTPTGTATPTRTATPTGKSTGTSTGTSTGGLPEKFTDITEKLKKSTNSQTKTKYIPSEFYYPANADQVSAIIKELNKQPKKWRIRSGGHSYESQSLINGGAVIDLEKLQEISVAADGKSVEVGAGVLLGVLYKELTDRGKYLNAGTVPWVGISGLTLGGGIGFAHYKNGPTCESVMSADVVLADGTFLENIGKDATHGNLLIAIKGGGPFYAVVTKWKFKIFDAPTYVNVTSHSKEGVTVADAASRLADLSTMTSTPMANLAMIEYMYATWGDGKLYQTMDIHMWDAPAYTALTEATWGKPTVDNLPKYPIAPKSPNNTWKTYFMWLLNKGQGKNDGYEWKDMTQDKIAEFSIKDSGDYTACGFFLTGTEMATQASKILQFVDDVKVSKGNCFVQIRPMKKETQKVDNSWPHYNTDFECQVYYKSPDMGNWKTYLEKFITVPKYFNYINSEITKPEDYFGNNLEKLKLVKTTYDPNKLIMTGGIGNPV